MSLRKTRLNRFEHFYFEHFFGTDVKRLIAFRESYPIIIALDETGSMGRIPDNLITNLLPKIMKRIMDAGIPNPQVCFMGFGRRAGFSSSVEERSTERSVVRFHSGFL